LRSAGRFESNESLGIRLRSQLGGARNDVGAVLSIGWTY
jgi:hypothetical protein